MGDLRKSNDVISPLALEVKTAAAHLGIHPITLQKLLRAGTIHGVRVGRKWIVPVKSIEEFLAKGQNAV